MSKKRDSRKDSADRNKSAEGVLPDAFMVRESAPELELRVQVWNINEGFNEELKEACSQCGSDNNDRQVTTPGFKVPGAVW